MNGRRMGAWACAVVVGFCAVCGRAEEVVGVRELTADTVLTNLTGTGTITCSAAQPVTLTLHSTEQSEFKGTIGGAIRIVKTGTGQLRLTSQAASSFSGGLEIEAGIYSQVAAVGSGPITVRGNGGLVFMVGGTLTNQLTFAESGKLGVWRGFTLTLRQMPDMRKAKVTFTDGGTFYFPEPLTDVVAGGTVFAVDKGVLSLPANVFGAGDGLLVSSLSLTAGSLDGGMYGNVQGYLSRLHARGTVALPDLSLAGGRRPLTGDEIPVEIADTAQGDPRTLTPPPAFVFGGRVTVTADTVIDGVAVEVASEAAPTEIFVAAGKTLALSNAVVQTAGAGPGGLLKTGAGTLAFHDVLDIEGRMDVMDGTVAFGAGVQTMTPATLGLVHAPSVVRFGDGAVADLRLGLTSNVHTGFLATAGIWFDAAALRGREGTVVSAVPNFGTAGGAFTTTFAFGRTGQAPTFSAAGLAGKPALAFNGRQSLALAAYTNTSDQITVFTVLQCDAYYPTADGRGLWVGFFSTCTPNADYLGQYGEDEGDPGSLHTSFAQPLDATYDTVEKTFSRLSVRQGARTLYTLDAQGQLPIGAPFLFAHRREGAAHAGSLYWDAAAAEATAGGTAETGAFTARLFSLGGRLTRAGQPNEGRLFTGKIGELLVFDRALTPAETAFVKAYLKNKWFGTALDAALETEEEPPVPQRRATLDVPAGTAHVALVKADAAQALLLSKTGAGCLGFSDAGGAARRLDVQEGALALRPPEQAVVSGKAVIWLDADNRDSMTLDAAGAVVAARNLGTAGGTFTLSTAKGGVPYLTDGSGINGRRTLAFDNQSALWLASYTNNSDNARDLHLYGVFQRNGMKQQWGGPISFSCATDTESDHGVRGNFHVEDVTETTVKLFFGTTGSSSVELYALEGENLLVDGEPFLFVSHQGATWTANAFIRKGLDDLAATPWLAQSGQKLTAPRITLCQLGGRLKGGVPQDGRNGTDERLWAGWLGEFIVFDRALQRGEELQLLGYLRRKWFGKGEGPDTPPACLRRTSAAGRTHAGLDLALASGTALQVGVTNQPLASLALEGVAVTSELDGEAARGPLFALAGGADLTGALAFETDRFPSGGVTFFTYGTSVSGTPAWTLAGERGDLMRARDEKSARRYVFAAPGGSVIFVR